MDISFSKKLFNPLYWHIRKMVLNHDDANDLLQNTFMKAWNALDSFRGESQLSTWLYRIAHNVCLDWLRRPAARAQSISLQALGEAGFEPEDPQPTPETRYLQSSEKQRLQAAIATLPPEQQTLINLRYGDGLSYEALASALNVEAGTVKSRLNRVKGKLRGMLADF